MKADPSRLIPRKPIENLELLFITAGYNIIFGNTILVLDSRLLWTCFVSENEE